MVMKLTETTVSTTAVRVRYADASDPPVEWMEIQVPLSLLKEPRREAAGLGDPEFQFLAELHRATLQHVRHAINGEIQRLAELSGRSA